MNYNEIPITQSSRQGGQWYNDANNRGDKPVIPICENQHEIYNMRLHQTIRINQRWYVMRVPGGWLYTYGGQAAFVPMNREYSKSGRPRAEHNSEEPARGRLY